MLINKTNRDIVHHFDAYMCDESFVLNETIAQECGSIRLPEHIANACYKSTFLAWSIGGQYVLSGFKIDKCN